MPRREKIMRLSTLVGMLLLVAVVEPSLCQDMVLDYRGRYHSQPSETDHQMDVCNVGSGRVVLASNRGLALVEISALPPGGTTDYIDRLTVLNARDVYLKDGQYLYVNLNRANASQSTGFAVVQLLGDTLQYVTTIEEPDVLYEKMDVDGNYLYVAAHSYGIRIFSLADPLNPVLEGSLTDGFVDAFAIDVHGDSAYVADGAGGLKIVDVSNKAAPVLVAGENLATAVGTAEDVSWHDGHVFVAVGGAGVAVFENGDLGQRTVYPVNSIARDLSWVGNYLAVTDGHGLLVFGVGQDASLSIVAKEVAARRGPNATWRLCSAAASEGMLIVCSNWNFSDVYELVPAAQSSQADISPSVQRIRFSPNGGTADVTLYNFGAADLVVSGVSSSSSAFQCSYTGGTIAPSDSASFQISYDGSPGNALGTVSFISNDPDESPFAIQVFGRTPYLDPGEPAVDFTLPLISKDQETGQYIEESFTLSDHLGKVVWFQVYGTW
jgi:hypothetical protein